MSISGIIDHVLMETDAKMTVEELLCRAKQLIRADGVDGFDYDEIVRTLTTANYVSDLCIKALEDRGLLEYYRGVPVIPDMRPPHMFIEHVLSRPAMAD